MKFNINDDVWVKLTDKGREIYYHKDDNLNMFAGKLVIKPQHPTEINGWCKFLMWELIELFGRHISPTLELPFETEISLTDPTKGE